MYDNYNNNYEHNEEIDKEKEKENEAKKKEEEEKKRKEEEKEIQRKLRKEEQNFDMIKRVQEEAYRLNDSLNSSINAATANLMNLPINRRRNSVVTRSSGSAPTVTVSPTPTAPSVTAPAPTATPTVSAPATPETPPEKKSIPTVSAVLPVQKHIIQQDTSSIPRL